MTAPANACAACHAPLPEDSRFCPRCGAATPTEPEAPSRTMATGAVELAKVRSALADRYRIERVLGEGGMATVYLADDLKHHRKVAVKVMRPELAATLGAERFLREIEIAAQLSHPHILPVHDSGETAGILYYVMPYVDGESLRERLQREGRLPVDEALRLGREVAEALGYAHRHRIIHRDIKPANVMLSEGHSLVADFGIARAAGGGQVLTQTGLAVGTPQYMSPEQASGERDIDARSDVYAIGAMLYEMLAGTPPYTGSTPQAVLAKSLMEEMTPLATVCPGVPAQVAAVVTKAMARAPAERYASGTELEQALAAARDAVRSGVTPVAVAAPSAGKAWGLFGLAAVVSLAVVYGLVSRWGLARWTLGLAAGLLVIEAGLLIVTSRVEARRRAGRAVTGLWRWAKWTNAARGGGLAAALWVTVALVLVFRGPGGRASTGEGIHLAVLPFDNRGDASDSYFVDGIADEVRGKLTGLPGFRVTARSSSTQYRQTSKPPKQIGSELSVAYLLTATVRWARTPDGKGQVHVVPELINAQTGDATWQQTFDADVTDVFQVQTAIASKVAAALGVALGANDQQQLAQRPTENLAAYDLYLQGRALTGNDPITLKARAGLMDQAVALDPKFAEAWGDLASALALLYFNGTPDPVVAARAKAAAERGLALGKGGAIGHWAMARYRRLVLADMAGAADEMDLALRASPNDADILRTAGQLEASLGRWDQAIAYAERARRLDPRSFAAATALSELYLRTRQYDKALAAGNDALALAPAEPEAIEDQAMVHLARGDLASARALIAGAPGSLARPALLAYLGNYYDLYWVLTDEDQKLLLRLPASAFFDDPAVRADVFMQTYWLRGDQARARAYADTSRVALEEQLRAAPQDPQRHVFQGLALAYLGRKAEAIAEGERGVALLPLSRDAHDGPYYQHQLVRIYLLVGEPEKALDRLEPLLQVPYYLSPGWLRIDPTFAALKGNPRFERLIAGR